MHTPTFTAIQAIQAILAPALGISAVGLLLLGLLNRYSNPYYPHPTAHGRAAEAYENAY